MRDNAKRIEATRGAVPKRLKKLRGKLSQRAFARGLGVYQQNQNRYELGTVPAFDYLATLALAGVDLNWLVLGIGTPMRDGRTSFDAAPRQAAA